MTRDEMIKTMAKAGAKFSAHLRNPWTGERERSSIQSSEYTGALGYLRMLLALPKGDPIIDYCGNGGLDTWYAGAPDQYNWNAERWEAEIRKRM